MSELLEAFVAAVSNSGQVWGLKGADGWALCDSIEFEDTAVFPFFSTEAAARALCTEAWAAYQPAALPLEDFLNEWLPGLHEDNAMLGIDWNNDMEGEEVEPADLAAAFDAIALRAD